MTTDDHDPIVARALRDMPVPEHLPGFWDALDQRLAEEGGDDAGDVLGSSREDIRVSTAELPAVIDLRPPPQRQPSPNRHRFLAVAAAVAVLAITAGVVLRGDGDSEQQATPTTPAPPVQQGSTFDEPPQGGDPQLDTSTPEAVVDAWLQALAVGDEQAAASLVGPSSRAQIATQGRAVEEIMREQMEGFGPWGGETDLTTHRLDIPGTDAAVVVYQGAYLGEGESTNLYRADAFPAEELQPGQWVVEPYAFTRNGRVTLVSPPRASTLSPTTAFEARAPEATTYWISLDGQPAEEAPDGSWTPTEPMAAGDHFVVVVAVGLDSLSAYATTFAVDS